MPNQGVRYGRVCSRCRTEDEAILRLAVGEGSTSVCGRRGGQAGAWRVEYIAQVLECDPKTIRQGLRDLEEAEDAAAGRIRKKGVDARS